MDLSLSKCILNYKILRQRNREMLEFYPGERDAMLLSELLFQKQVWAYAWIDRKIRTSQENAELREMAARCRENLNLICGNRDCRFYDRASALLPAWNNPLAYLLCAVSRRLYHFVRNKRLES